MQMNYKILTVCRQNGTDVGASPMIARYEDLLPRADAILTV
jgi:hypothetical protein